MEIPVDPSLEVVDPQLVEVLRLPDLAPDTEDFGHKHQLLDVFQLTRLVLDWRLKKIVMKLINVTMVLGSSRWKHNAIFRDTFNTEVKSSTQRERFFNVYLPIVWAEGPDSEFENFICQIVAKLLLNATEIISQIRTKVEFFLKKLLGFYEKNLIFSKNFERGKFAVLNDSISRKCFFHLNCEVFLPKNQKKIIWKNYKIMQSFLKKKTVLSF